MADTSGRQLAWLGAVVMLTASAAVRTAYVALVPRMLDSADAVHYLETARLLAQGDYFAVDPKIPLLYPTLTAVASLFFSNIETAGQAVSFLFSVLLVAPVYLLSLHLHGERSARVVGVLVALWPWLVDYSNRVATEPVAVFCWMLGVLCVVRGLEPQARFGWMIGAALSFGALHLARAEGTFLLLSVLGAGAIAGWRGDGKSVGRKIGIYIATVGVVLILHAFYLHRLVGEWTVNYRVGFIGEQPEGSTVLVELGRTLIAMTADVPAVMLGPLLWAFFGIGLVAPRKSDSAKFRGELVVLYFAAVQWLVVIPVLSPAPRYLMAVFVALLLWSGRGIVYSSMAIGARSTSGWARAVPLVAVVAWMGMHLGAAIAHERRDDGGLPPQPWEYKIAGEWMHEHLEPGPIVTRKPQVGFYADMPTIGLAENATLDSIVGLSESAGVRYLVVDERYSVQLVPALRPLLDPANAPASMRLVKGDLSPYSAGRIIIYELASH